MNSTSQLARDPQAHLPTGPTHVASRSAPPPRTAAEVESNSAFLAAAGRVEFGRYEATLERIWMAFAYFASLGPERTCYGSVEHIAEKARRSASTLRRHAPTLIDRGLLKPDQRKGGRVPSTWKVVLPADVLELTSFSPSVRGSQNDWAGQSKRLGRAVTVTDDIRDRGKREKRTSSRRARVVCQNCGHDFPDGYGSDCHECGYDPSKRKPSTVTLPSAGKSKSAACTCKIAYSNSHRGKCLDCKGKPSAAQIDAVRAKDGCMGEDDRVGEDGGGYCWQPRTARD